MSLAQLSPGLPGSALPSALTRTIRVLPCVLGYVEPQEVRILGPSQ